MKKHQGLLVLSSLVAVAACSSPSTPAPSEATPPFARQATASKIARKISKSTKAAELRAPWVAAAKASAGAPATASEPAAKAYPAFKPNAPQIVDNGGVTLKHMKIATLTWNDDPLAANLELFGDTLGASPVWKSVKEYGVGATSSGPSRHFRGSGLPATITDVQLDALVQSSVQDTAASGWPAEEAEEIYAVYLPPTTTFLVDNGDGTTTPACQLFGAYHTATQPLAPDGGPAGKPILYAVMPRCYPAIDGITAAASHEFGETATDAYVNQVSTTAYVGFDQSHLAYDIYQSFQDENGDACENFGQSYYEEAPPFTWVVQRLWSNKSAASGHNPCLPLIADEAYYNATSFANQQTTITVDFSATAPPGACTAASPCTATTQGYKVPLGQSLTFDIGFYSDAPTADWTVQGFALPRLPIADYTGKPVTNGNVVVTIDRPTGNNGHKAHVTVTPITAGALGVEYVELQSGYGQGEEAHSLPILIGQN